MAILHETWFVCWVVPMYTEIFVPRKIWRNKMCTHICANWLEPLIWQHFSTFLLLQRRVSVPINEWVRWRRSKGVNLKSLPLWWKKAITATTFELWQHPGKIRKYILALDHRRVSRHYKISRGRDAEIHHSYTYWKVNGMTSAVLNDEQEIVKRPKWH